MTSIVRGVCPGCHFSSLTLTDDGHIICTRPGCPEPDAISGMLHAGIHQLPTAIKAFLDPGPYLCPACETAQLCETAHAEHPGRGLDAEARRLHGECRKVHPFTGAPCARTGGQP